MAAYTQNQKCPACGADLAPVDFSDHLSACSTSGKHSLFWSMNTRTDVLNRMLGHVPQAFRSLALGGNHRRR